MGVIRVEKDRNFTHMSNYHLKDKRLSLKAVGLLSKILSLPDNWDYSVAGLTSICKEGKSSIRAAIEELEKAGYLIRTQIHSGDGTFGGYDYKVYERPPKQKAPLSENRKTVQESSSPLSENPMTDNPSTENRTQLNTKPIKDLNNNIRASAAEPAWEPELFNRFYALYPRKRNRKAAVAAWDKLKPDKGTMLAMSRKLKRDKESEQWQESDGRYVPYPATWINAQPWLDGDDEASAAPQAKAESDVPIWS